MTDNYVKVPTDWAPAPEGFALMPQANVLLGTGQIEVRSVFGKLEWRRTPEKKH